MKQRITACLFAALAAASLQGATLNFTNRATFLAQASNWTVVDFEVLPNNFTFIQNQTPAGITLGNLKVLGIEHSDSSCGYCVTKYETYIYPQGFAGAGNAGSGAFALAGYSVNGNGSAHLDARGETVFTPQVPTYTLGFDYLAYEPFAQGKPPVGFTITLSNGHTLTGTSNTTSQFIGFVSDTPISWLSVEFDRPATGYNTARIGFDDVTYSATETPEPATSGLILGAGLAAIAVRNMRSHRRTA